MKIRIIKEVHSEKQRRWACAQDDPKIKAMCDDPMKEEVDETDFSLDLGAKQTSNSISAARHQFKNTMWKPSRDKDIEGFFGTNLAQIAKISGRLAKQDEFRKKLITAIQSDTTAADRIGDAQRTGDFAGEGEQLSTILLQIAAGGGKEMNTLTIAALQNYISILMIEYGLIHSYRWGPNQPWVKKKEFILAWVYNYLASPSTKNPKSFADRHKADMQKAQKQGFIKDFDPENILYALRENKNTIKCLIRRKK